MATWNDNTGDSPIHRLLVTRRNLNGTTEVCNNSSSSLVGTLNCQTDGVKGSYFAQFYRTVDGEETLINTLTLAVGGDSDTFGREGMIWAFLIGLTLIAVGIFSPVIGIMLYVIFVITVGLTGIIFINPAIVIAHIILGAFFWWAFKS